LIGADFTLHTAPVHAAEQVWWGLVNPAPDCHFFTIALFENQWNVASSCQSRWNIPASGHFFHFCYIPTFLACCFGYRICAEFLHTIWLRISVPQGIQ